MFCTGGLFMVNRIDYQQYVPTDSLNRQRNEQVNQISNQIKEQVQDKTGTIVAENQNDISKEQVKIWWNA